MDGVSDGFFADSSDFVGVARVSDERGVVGDFFRGHVFGAFLSLVDIEFKKLACFCIYESVIVVVFALGDFSFDVQMDRCSICF